MGEYTLWSATQIPHILKITLSMTVGIPETKLRVIAPEVGGGFGSKLNVYAEEAIAVAVARRLGKPVKWIEERSENYVATIHGRGVLQEMELAATEEGKVTAVRARLTADFGAYYQLVTPGIPLLGAFLYGGVYDIQGYFFECTGVFTNKTPTDAYRGAGRPEATYAIERAMDALARRVGKDPAEIRRLNLIPPFEGRSRPGSRSTPATSRGRSTRRWSGPTTMACAASRRSGGSAATRSSSGSACPRTSRCAGSRPPRCWRR